ncbi:MAG: S26 family signal peptidase, partial [Bacteroides sp.]|nr:S26 family signal peptidase [Bacteroides sp.]
VIYWSFLILAAIIVSISLRLFLFDRYLIPTPSMEPVILTGDYVVVNKLVPGPRLIKTSLL